jgi:8-oxo-(d)GTP phosphatase
VAAVTVQRAAGGVLWRTGPDGVEVLAVHRPRYGDWSLPKGKLKSGEPELVGAVREVFEETGVTGVPQVRLHRVQYLTGVPGVEKQVTFWTMRVFADAGREPDDEVTEVRWVPVARAPGLLTYAHDRGLVAEFAALPTVDSELVLVRHANAGSRHAWTGDDDLRPLDERGRWQATRLAHVLSLFHPTRLVAAPALRCQQTLEPLAAAGSAPEEPAQPIRTDARLSEEFPGGVAAATDAVLELATPSESVLVCGHGKVIPGMLESLKPGNARVGESFATPKGGGWIVAFAGTRAVAAERLPLY